MDQIYGDIAQRTGGNVYIGVVGPVRTGKSTLIKRIMEQMVIPCISDPYRAERARDELPQSGSGRTIMTSEPKFVPEEAVEISPDGKQKLRVRFIDSVGYLIPGAVGAEEDGQPRMVTTPWYDREIPMTQAAELGTKKVMQEHCTIGLVVTTDGTVTDIPRGDYREAEGRAIRDMQATGKPYLVVLNSREPGGDAAQAAARELEALYGVEPLILDAQAVEGEGITRLLRSLLYSFPMTELRIFMPRWLDALEQDHPVKSGLYRALLEKADAISSLGQAEQVLAGLGELEMVQDYSLRDLDQGTGIISCVLTFPEKLFYEVLSSQAGMEIENDGALLNLLTELSAVKKEYDRISNALSSVRATGYGVVMPQAGDLQLENPELVRKGGAYGVKLKAAASSVHMIRVDIATEISPMVGDEKQSQELIEHLRAQGPEELWQSNIFGKSVCDMIREGMNTKLVRLPEDVREKFRGTLTKIVNEGANGLICLIL